MGVMSSEKKYIHTPMVLGWPIEIRIALFSQLYINDTVLGWTSWKEKNRLESRRKDWMSNASKLHSTLKPCLNETFTPDRTRIRSGLTV